MNPRLDTVQGCLSRLAEIEAEIEEFRPQAYKDAGDLARAEKDWKDRYDTAMRVVTGPNADVRAALCREAVKEASPGLWESILELTGRVRANDKNYELLDTQRSIAQSCLKTHRSDAERLDQPGGRYDRPIGWVGQ